MEAYEKGGWEVGHLGIKKYKGHWMPPRVVIMTKQIMFRNSNLITYRWLMKRARNEWWKTLWRDVLWQLSHHVIPLKMRPTLFEKVKIKLNICIHYNHLSNII
jgi:hypothetical protein